MSMFSSKSQGGGSSYNILPLGNDISDEPMADDEEELEDDRYDYQPTPTPVEGVFRASYGFEPEGGAEMELIEGQEVWCLGRGGGDGWLIAVRSGYPDDVAHALVPEGYLEFQRPFEGNEHSLAKGSLMVDD